MSHALIELLSVSKIFNNNIVIKNLSIKLKSNETYILKGENGSGKSTFIKLIIDVYKPTSGTIIRQYKDIRYVPELITIKSDIIVEEYIKKALALRNIKRDISLESFLELELNKPLKHLSKGNQKKVMLYLAFVGNPQVLCLDEPLDGLDVFMQKKVIAYLETLNTTNIISTHMESSFQSLMGEVILFEVG